VRGVAWRGDGFSRTRTVAERAESCASYKRAGARERAGVIDAGMQLESSKSRNRHRKSRIANDRGDRRKT
jgi:hypothetical protein